MDDPQEQLAGPSSQVEDDSNMEPSLSSKVEDDKQPPMEASTSAEQVVDSKPKSAKKPGMLAKLKSNKLKPIEMIEPKPSKSQKKTKKVKPKNEEPKTEERSASNGETSSLVKQNRIVYAAPQLEGQSMIAIEYNGDSNSVQSHGTLNENKNNLHPSAEIYFKIVWNNVTYYPPESFFGKQTSSAKEPRSKQAKACRPILNNLSGSIESGQMIAIIGPSGAGKTTFLNCLAGFCDITANKNNTGSINIKGIESVKVGFVEQFDQLLPYLTVWETLMFASKIRNSARFYLNHKKVVRNILECLDLMSVSHIRVARCSNGQRKRLSIAIELACNYDLIILDEPTSGLDVVSGYQIIQTMKQLVKRKPNMCVLATIHQPSSAMLKLFDNLIVLSCEGSIIYQGTPADITRTLALVGLTVPQFYNMSDFLLEVASGDFGRQSLHHLVHYNKENQRNLSSNDYEDMKTCSLRKAIKKASRNDNRSFLLCTWLLLVRQLMGNARNNLVNVIRFMASVGDGCLVGFLFTDVVGAISTCPMSKNSFWRMEISSIMDHFEQQQTHSRENMAVIFILALFSMFTSMYRVAVTFPSEVFVFRREYNNYSYHLLAYFIAIILGDMPFDMPTTTIFVVFVHRLTGQIFTTWERLLLVILPCCLITIIGQLIGMIIGVIFYKDLIAGLFAVILIVIPIFLCSGFFKLITTMSEFVLYFSYVSFMRPTVNAILIAIYGLERCQQEIRTEMQAALDRNESQVLTRPQWIKSLASLIELQTSVSEAKENEIYKNKSIEPEVKLLHYMGMKIGGHDGDKAYILSYFDIDDDYQAYWHQIYNLLLYTLFFVAFLFLTIKLKIKRRV